MSESTAPDSSYVAARRVLLDVLTALGPHRDAVIAVGAQAVYLRVGSSGIPLAPSEAPLGMPPARLDRGIRRTPAFLTLLLGRLGQQAGIGPRTNAQSEIRRADSARAQIPVRPPW
ncbi:MAG: hypothetical protein ACRDUY_10105 [Nitriliruptorales bacterium]